MGMICANSWCKRSFDIADDEVAFLKKLTFTFGDRTIEMPLSDRCPDCRTQARTAHRNEQFLYKTRSKLSGKEIVALYAPNPVAGKALPVYSQDEWRSDAWDPLSYGRDVDFTRSFFEQFAALQHAVPRMALITIANENSDFSTGTGYCKNCYLINSSENCEDCYYGKLLQKCRDSVDCSYLYDSELCYECFSVFGSHNCQHLSFSQDCQDCFFSSNLKSCKNCCLCTNLDHKEYYFQNEPLRKEAYEKRLTEFRGSFTRTQQMKELWKRVRISTVKKYANIMNSEGCTGDYIENSKNCLECYDVTDSQDCRSVQVGVNVKDNYHCSNMYLKPELCYETLGTIEVHTVAFCLYIFHSQRMLYSEYCFHCSDCFGCSGLTRKKFCVFNKQYSKEEYASLVPNIIDHMKTPYQSPAGSGSFGKFFPSALSPFGYNETLASEYFPLKREEAIARGFHWREKDARDFLPQKAPVPESIAEVTDQLLQEIFSCEDCRKNFRIIPQELAFYRRNLIAIPHICPDCRNNERMQQRNSRKLHDRNCSHCAKSLLSTYHHDRKEVILCEECFRSALYA